MKGGFFDGLYGIALRKYEERAQKRKNVLNEVEQKNKILEKQGFELEKKHEELKQQKLKHFAELSELKSEISILHSRLDQTEIENLLKIEEKKSLEQKLETLRKEIEHLKKIFDETSVEEMEERLNNLENQKNILQQQILELSFD
jgi:chromosome segregation ATPase